MQAAAFGTKSGRIQPPVRHDVQLATEALKAWQSASVEF
jgi:hypothetical protein